MTNDLGHWFKVYHAEVMPNANPATVRAWNNATDLSRRALGREPTIDDLTVDGLRIIRIGLRKGGATDWTIRIVMQSLNELWRFVESRGKANETPRKERTEPPTPQSSNSLMTWFRAYHSEAMPDAKPNTVNGWTQAVTMTKRALRRDPTIDDLTTHGLSVIQQALHDLDYSRHSIARAMRVLVALWRFISDRGEAVETAPKRRHDDRGRLYGRGKARNSLFSTFEQQTGLTPIRNDDLPVVNVKYPKINLPKIEGPQQADFDAYFREVEAGRKANRAELRRLFGVMLFGWTQLYQEWAGISGKARNQWRFAILRFTDHLGHAPQLDDLTPGNLAGIADKFTANGRLSDSGRNIVGKLRCVWRFAWEVGALESGPPVNGGSWVAQRWTMRRFGRPSVKVKS